MEPATIIGAVGAFNHLFNITKGIKDDLKEAGKAEALEKVIELNNAILDLQQKHAQMFNETQALKEENRLLKQQKDLRSELKFKHGVYFRQIAGGWEYYCSVCLDRDGKYVQIPRFNDNHGRGVWTCRACKIEHYEVS